MRRREVLVMSVAAGAWPFAAARAQSFKPYQLAVVHPSFPASAMSRTGEPDYRAYFNELHRLGYEEGRNLLIHRLSGNGQADQYKDLAFKTVQLKPDVILANSRRVLIHFKEATHDIPIIGVTSDPIAAGLAATLARPGGNITGASIDAGLELIAKRLNMLREVAPSISRVAFLAPREAWDSPYGMTVRQAARLLKLELIGPPLDAPINEGEYRRVFSAFTRNKADAVDLADVAENLAHMPLITELVKEVRLPSVSTYRQHAEHGGLLSYAIDRSDMYRRLAQYTVAVLEGQSASDLPFFQPDRFELVVNLKAARTLNLTIPSQLLAQADDVIE